MPKDWLRRGGQYCHDLVGTARRAVRAAYQRRNGWHDSHATRDSFRPLLRGRDAAARRPCHSKSAQYLTVGGS
jgi:hypothetical protein